MRLRSAPAVLAGPFGSIEHALCARPSAHDAGGEAFVEGLSGALGERLSLVPGLPDQWPQDHVEFASIESAIVRMDVALVSPDAMTPVDEPRETGRAGIWDGLDWDQFGDIEVTPPTEVHGTMWPHGVVLTSARTDDPGRERVVDSVLQQGVQGVVRLPTGSLSS